MIHTKYNSTFAKFSPVLSTEGQQLIDYEGGSCLQYQMVFMPNGVHDDPYS